MAAHSVAFANSRPPFNSDWYITNDLCIHMWSRFSGFSFMLDLTNDRPLVLKVIWKILPSVSKNGIYKKKEIKIHARIPKFKKIPISQNNILHLPHV